jgi:hypothetical protein
MGRVSSCNLDGNHSSTKATPWLGSRLAIINNGLNWSAENEGFGTP